MRGNEIFELLYRIDEGYEPSEEEMRQLAKVDALGFLSSEDIRSELPQSMHLLQKLRHLMIWEPVQITSLAPLSQIKTLKSIDCWHGSSVSDLSPLKNLPDLEELRFNRCPIADISSLSNLKKLRILSLQEAKITDILPLAGLRALVELNIAGTGVTRIAPIQNIPKLEALYLNGSPIEDLSCLASLKSLRRLSVNSPQTCHPEFGKWISHVTNLSLVGSPISDLSSLRPCTQLEELNISYTNVRQLPSWLGEISSLRRLGLASLQLHHIPASLLKLNLSFVIEDTDSDYVLGGSGIFLKGTTLAVQPISLFEQSRAFIEAYYEAEKVPINQSKVIFLGKGGVGKTHTIMRLRNHGEPGKYETEPTPGIDINAYSAEYEGGTFDINFWDFGGQEIMHAMHQCFLTERTFYVVILSARGDSNDLTAEARRWLRNIQSFAPKARVLLALNRWEGVPSGGIDIMRLRNEFETLCPEPIYYSAKNSTKEEFNRLTEAIVREAAALDSASMEFPRQWANIRQKLLKHAESKPYIDKEEYHRICTEEGLDAANIRTWLLEWFNDLGVCFSYHQDKNKKDEPVELDSYKVLNPRWLTNGIYILITNGKEYAENGKLHCNIIRDLLKNPELGVLKGVTYDKDERNYVLDVMRKFKLSYKVSETHEFIPALCSENTPTDLHPTNFSLHVSYQMQYSFLPDSVIHQLMIRCYENLNFSKLWRKGMRLDIPFAGLCAVVDMGDDDSTLRMDVYGHEDSQPWKLLQYLRTHISEINRSMGLNGEDSVIVRDGDYEDTISIQELLCAKEEQDTTIKRFNKNQNRYFRCNVNDLLRLTFGEAAMMRAQELAIEKQVPVQNIFNHCTIGSVDFYRQSADADYMKLITYLFERQAQLDEAVIRQLIDALKQSENEDVRRAAAEAEKEPKKGLFGRLKGLLETTGSIAENSEKTYKAGKAIYKVLKPLIPLIAEKLPEIIEFIQQIPGV